MMGRWWWVVVSASLFGCGGSQRAGTSYEGTFVDVALEREVLFECADAETSARYEVAISSPSMQRVISAWEVDGDARARTSVSVLYDARLGPGMQVVRDRQHWTGESPASMDGDQWRAAAPHPGDHDLEEELALAIQRCWRQTREEYRGARLR